MSNPLIQKVVKKLEQDRGYSHWKHSYHRDMVTCWTTALRNAVEPKDDAWDAREAVYMENVEKYGRETIYLWTEVLGDIVIDAMNDMGDILGEITMQLGMGVKGHGQFFTPYSLSRLTASMMFDEQTVKEAIEARGFLSLSEPACGSGGKIVAYAQSMVEHGFGLENLRVTAQDIDKHCVNMTYVQMRLFNIPAVVIHGDTLKVEEREVLITPAYVEQEEHLKQRV